MANPSIELNKRLVYQDEDCFIENVNYHMKSLSLLTDCEINHAQTVWEKLLNGSENFFVDIFLRTFSLDESSKYHFEKQTLISNERLIKTEEVKRHSKEALDIMNKIVKNINKPNDWMLEVFKIATVHKLYEVAPSSLHAFKEAFLEALGNVIKGDEDISEKIEVWERVLNSVLECMNECIEDAK